MQSYPNLPEAELKTIHEQAEILQAVALDGARRERETEQGKRVLKALQKMGLVERTWGITGALWNVTVAGSQVLREARAIGMTKDGGA